MAEGIDHQVYMLTSYKHLDFATTRHGFNLYMHRVTVTQHTCQDQRKQALSKACTCMRLLAHACTGAAAA